MKDSRERLAIAEMLAFWRGQAERTTCPLRLASYRRIINDLVALCEQMETVPNA